MADPLASLGRPLELPAPAVDASDPLAQFGRALDTPALNPAAPTLPDPGRGEAAAITLQNALSLQQMPKLAAAGGTLMAKLVGDENLIPELKGKGWGETYRKLARKEEELVEAPRQHYPGQTLGLNIAGAAPYYAFLPQTLGGQVGGSALLGGLQAAGASPAVAGSEPDTAKGVRDVAVGTAAGALGGAVPWWLTNTGADVLGGAADAMTRRGIGASRPELAKRLATVLPKDMEPGELTNALREADVAGGWRSAKDVAESSKEAFSKLGEQFEALRNRATAAGHPGVRISDVERLIQENSGDLVSGINARPAAVGLRDRLIDRLKTQALARRVGLPYDEVARGLAEGDQRLLGDFANMKTPFEYVTHEDFQNALSGSQLQKSAQRAYAAQRNPVAPVTEANENTLGIYDPARMAQDEALTNAGVGSGRTLRRTMAAMKMVEQIAGQRAEELKGHTLLGIAGEVAPAVAGFGTGHGAVGTAGALGLHLLRRAYQTELDNLAASGLSMGSNALRSLRRTPLATMAGASAVKPGVEAGYDFFSQPYHPPAPMSPATQEQLDAIRKAQTKRDLDVEAAKQQLQQPESPDDYEDPSLYAP